MTKAMIKAITKAINNNVGYHCCTTFYNERELTNHELFKYAYKTVSVTRCLSRSAKFNNTFLVELISSGFIFNNIHKSDKRMLSPLRVHQDQNFSQNGRKQPGETGR